LFKNLAHHLSIITLGLFTIVGIIGLVRWQGSGIRLYSVKDSSMAPLLLPGDLVLAASRQTAQPGDIVSYLSPQDQHTITARRLVAVDPSKGIITTKADNLVQADPPVITDAVLGKTLKAVPLLGYLLDTLRRPAGLAVLVYVPAFVIIRSEVKRLSRQFGRRPYNLKLLTSVTS